MPGLPLVAVTHPLGGIPEEEVMKKADSAVEEIIEEATQIGQSAQVEKTEKEHSIEVKGTLAEASLFFYSKGWTDGLPIFPPTRKAVQEMLTGTDLAPDQRLGIMPPQSGRVTVEKIAVNAVMAGCRPTYMPVADRRH